MASSPLTPRIDAPRIALLPASTMTSTKTLRLALLDQRGLTRAHLAYPDADLMPRATCLCFRHTGAAERRVDIEGT